MPYSANNLDRDDTESALDRKSCFLGQPEARGWTAATTVQIPTPALAVFGGLTGNDDSPVRLGDLHLLAMPSSL